MAAVPTDQLSPSSPLSFAYLLAEIWRCLHPSEEMPRYQVFRVPLEGSVVEYRADVFMEASLPLGRQTFSFRGGHAATTDRAIQLAALAGLTSLRHQESMMQQNRAFRLYPTLATAPRRVRFPRAPVEADPEVINLSRYVIAAFTLVFELANDARQARRALAATSAPSTPPPAPSVSGDPSIDRSA